MGLSSCHKFRRTAGTDLPHRAKLFWAKQVMAQQKKDSPVHNVLPLRTAPSHKMAS